MKRGTVVIKKTVTMTFKGFHMVYPSTPMLQKTNKDKSKSQVYWMDIAPCHTGGYTVGDWTINISFKAKR